MRSIAFMRHAIALLFVFALTAPAFAIPVLLVDMKTAQVLYANDAGQPWHPASLTKLMTAYVTFQAIANGRVSLDTPVIMTAEALKEPPAKVGTPVDTAFTLKDALYLMLVKSANDVAVAVAQTVSGSKSAFVEEMNATAQRMGLTATHYVDPNGLSDAGQVTSARDLAVLALNIRYQFPQYAEIFETHAVQLGKIKMRSENDLLTHFAGTTGMKTGYICESGLNIVATVDRDGRQLMAVVLGGASSRERGELTAEMFLRALEGKYQPSGQLVTQIANSDVPPMNMRPYVCGKDAKAYRAKRQEQFPMGLKGEPSYLTDDVNERIYQVSSLGRIRDVPVPRARPAWAPQPAVAQTPMPRPRPDGRAMLSAGL